MNMHQRMQNIAWSGFGVFVILYALMPVAWIISLSLKRPTDLNDQRFFPEVITFQHYQAIFKDAQFPAALWNSFGIALIATGLSVLLAMFAAYAIVRLEFPGKKMGAGTCTGGINVSAGIRDWAFVQSLAQYWFIRYLDRAGDSVHDVYLAIGNLDLICFF
jgi:ABC-type glycerol-3-phosphate transport system permease component